MRKNCRRFGKITKIMMSNYSNTFLQNKLRDIAENPPRYFIGSYQDKQSYAYCLTIEFKKETTVILSKHFDISDLANGKEEVISLQKIFNATIIEETI